MARIPTSATTDQTWYISDLGIDPEQVVMNSYEDYIGSLRWLRSKMYLEKSLRLRDESACHTYAALSECNLNADEAVEDFKAVLDQNEKADTRYRQLKNYNNRFAPFDYIRQLD